MHWDQKLLNMTMITALVSFGSHLLKVYLRMRVSIQRIKEYDKARAKIGLSIDGYRKKDR